ncbi:MAG: OsmC family peroxiredoxin [Candidatus Dadabacteria bacterium]|nr:MAG: OsmC family peroxiredoxin [Candidatus Dadabacteria bacterium]
MAVNIEGRYLGDKRVEVIHGPSGSKIVTDAPKDNHGLGRYFSPTDLIGASLGSCVLTILGIVAEKHGYDISGSSFELEKHMYSEPRRVGKLKLLVHLPSNLSEEARELLEKAGSSCPVRHSLKDDMEIEMGFTYDV